MCTICYFYFGSNKELPYAYEKPINYGNVFLVESLSIEQVLYLPKEQKIFFVFKLFLKGVERGV